MRYLLDTNVISELQKSSCNPAVKVFIENTPPEDLFLSTISIGEIWYGVAKLNDGKKKLELSAWLNNQLPEYFQERVLLLDNQTAAEWGRLRSRQKRTLPVIDSLIAATALVHRLSLVTRNTQDFEDIAGISLLNPWEYE
jgi:predicted nucleic acid-binding protein